MDCGGDASAVSGAEDCGRAALGTAGADDEEEASGGGAVQQAVLPRMRNAVTADNILRIIIPFPAAADKLNIFIRGQTLFFMLLRLTVWNCVYTSFELMTLFVNI